jgi:nitrogen regulatory protein PII
MKRIGLVLTEAALCRFQEQVSELGIEEFEVAQVRRASTQQLERQRLYRGQPFMLELVARTKVEFTLLDHDLEDVMASIDTAVRPDSVAIFEVGRMTHVGLHDESRKPVELQSKSHRPVLEFEHHRSL